LRFVEVAIACVKRVTRTRDADDGDVTPPKF
jgi:hypothetical protein